MNCKRLVAFFLSILMIFSLAACNNDKSGGTPQESLTDNVSENTDRVTESGVSAETTALSADNSEATEVTTVENAEDPATWSTAQIVEFYKSAAKKSNASAKSEQSIAIKDISVNNGEFEGLFDFIMPIMSKLIANNTEAKDGITGGYANLVESDVASAKAYRLGSNIAVEMVMREQTSGASDDANSGTVGHAITAVGDISNVINQLKDLGLPLEISEKDTKIYYTRPVVKVLVNPNGEIVNGTWRYTVEISLNNYKAFGKAVNTTSVVMDNTITVNGGFKK